MLQICPYRLVPSYVLAYIPPRLVLISFPSRIRRARITSTQHVDNPYPHFQSCRLSIR